MSNKVAEKYIRQVIKAEHDGKELKTKNDLIKAINDIIQKLNESEHDHDDTEVFVASYVHHSVRKGTYQISVKKKQKDVSNILGIIKADITETNTNTDTDTNTDKDDNTVHDSDDITDTELERLEAELELAMTQVNTNTNANTNTSPYRYPEQNYKVQIRKSSKYGPFGTDNLHDTQKDDVYGDDEKRRAAQFDVLRAIELPPQRTDAWYAMRNGMLTASDGGTVLGLSKYDPEYTVYVKKISKQPFESNLYCYHGKKHEEIATMIYERRMNIKIDEFGLMQHPVHKIVGASPDGICNGKKLDGFHKSKFVGRMLEIKCPYSRKIKMEGDVKGEICPIHYWVQVQLQLECCDLDECDFWQCKITEYQNRDAFLEDTDPDEPFLSKSHGLEKGCLIQLMPKMSLKEFKHEQLKEGFGEDKVNNMTYDDMIYTHAIFLYPPRIEMSPFECDRWISDRISQFHFDDLYDKWHIDKVIYWKLELSHNVTIPRDRAWFAEVLPKYRTAWNRILFLRENKEQRELLLEYISTRKRKYNDDIMKVIDKLCNPDAPNYDKYIAFIRQKIIESDKYSPEEY